MTQKKPLTSDMVPKMIKSGYAPPKPPVQAPKDVKRGFPPPKPPRPKK